MDSAKQIPSEKPDSSEESNSSQDATTRLHVAPPLDEKGLAFVLDLPLKVTVELGRTRILVQDLIKLHKGSVIELSKLAGEPLEILVNDRVVAKGEVIVVNEKFGIRLSEVVSHAQRIRELGA